MSPDLLDHPNLGCMTIAGVASSSLPLEHTSVKVQINALLVQVAMTQRFTNPLTAAAELEYLFAMPEKAKVIDFSFQIGERSVRADLQETKQAEAAYQQARDAGQHTALLDRRRPNVFAIRLANVLPGEKIEVHISYEEQALYRDGEIEWVLPMGITPRYASDPHSKEAAEVSAPIAFEGEPVGPVEIEVMARPGVPCGQPSSPSHALLVTQPETGLYQVGFAKAQIPDHDFVLRFPVEGNTLAAAAWSASDAAGDCLLLHWLPPANQEEKTEVPPREFIFVLDRSGSMSGQPIRQACNALSACLRILETHDTFNILLFDDRLEWYQRNTLSITQTHIDKTDGFLSQVDGRGGTEIIPALEAALSLETDAKRTRYVVFLTDGAVSADERALQTVRQKLGRARIFTFGIGPSVNRALLNQLARIGRGTAEFLQLDEDIEGAILRFQDKVAFPALTDIRLEWRDCTAWDVYPSLMPDLYAGQSFTLNARVRFNSPAGGQLAVNGRRGGQEVHFEIPLAASTQPNPAIVRAWAQARIDDLVEGSETGRVDAFTARQEIIALALANRLATAHTTFVAIDNAVVNAQGAPTPLQIALPLPAGLNIAGFVAGMPAAQTLGMPAPLPSAPPQMARRTFAPTRSQEPPSLMDAVSNIELPQFLRKRLKRAEEGSAAKPAPEFFAAAEETRQAEAAPAEPFDPEKVLRWLARAQQLDGSWNNDVETTAAALMAFLRHGHTTRSGNYRKQVQRAIQWLAGQKAPGRLAHLLAWVFRELADVVPSPEHSLLCDQALLNLPEARTDFEHAVRAKLFGNPLPPAPAQIGSAEDARLAVLLGAKPVLPASGLSSSAPDLLSIWCASI